MTTVISSSQMLPNKMSSSIPDFVPREMSIQSGTITRKGPVEYCDVMSHYEETASIVHSQTFYENDEIAKSHFNGGNISILSEISLLDMLPDISPLDYPLGWSTDENDNLINCIQQNASVFMSDIASMEVDSFCTRPNEWEMKSVGGDSIGTEEDISSTLEWINNSEDFWKC